MKLYQKHQPDIGNKYTEQNFDFIIILVAMATKSKKKLLKYLKMFSSNTTGLILLKLRQKYQCVQAIQNGVLISLLFMATECKKR